MKALLLGLGLVSLSATGANIYVVDSGLYPQYRQQLEDSGRLLNESCFSAAGDLDDYVVADTNNNIHRGFYFYKGASLCQNTQGEDHGEGASVLRTGLRGAVGRQSSDDEPVPVITAPHHNIIANVITNNTAPGVKQWHAHDQALVGRTDNTGKLVFTRYDSLNQITSIPKTLAALEDLNSIGQSLNGVRVVSISSIVPEIDNVSERRYTSPCDNHPTVRGGIIRDYADAIQDLRSKGVLIVVGTDNTRDDIDLDNYKMPFPACLSTTVAVGGIDSIGRAQGALDTRTDFIAPYSARDPITGGLRTGTSYATPLVASYVADLRTLNPTKTVNQVLNILRNTADTHFGSRDYAGTTVQYQIRVPNIVRAKDSVVDSFWKDFIQLLTGRLDEGVYGWNHGSSRHDNGVLSYFETVNVPQNNVVSITDENGLTTKITQASSTDEQVLRFSLRAFDIDTVDEVEVLVNDKFYGYLKTTGNNVLGGTQAICISGSDLKSDETRNEVKLRLKNSGETWGVQNIKIEVGTVDNTCLKAPPIFPNLPSNSDRLVGTSEPSGNAYQRAKVNQVPFSFDLRSANNGLPTSTTYNGKTIQRDLRVKFTIKSGAVSNATTLKVNGNNVLTTSSSTGDTERGYEFIVNRNRLVGGTNTFEFRPSNTGANSVWGIRGISIEYIDPITLSVGANNVIIYGYNQNPTRYTGLRANFTLGAVENDYVFTAQGWGIDRADETQIFINGVPLGFLNVGSSSGLSSIQSFVVTREFLLSGINQIEFAQRRPGSGWSGVSFEQWGVEDINVSVLRPDLTATSTRVVDSKIEKNVPFSLSTVIRNVGAGSSSATTVNYYTSTDTVIDSADTFLESRTIGVLNPGAVFTFVNEVQSSLVGEGYYIGVCLAAVPNEITAGNNCSKGIKLRSSPPIVPIIMMLIVESAGPPAQSYHYNHQPGND
jgi:hypothetical protein